MAEFTRRRKPTGRPARLTRAQKQALLRQLRRGALAAGFPTDRWTMGRGRQPIEPAFGVPYHVKYINRLLAQLPSIRYSNRLHAVLVRALCPECDTDAQLNLPNGLRQPLRALFRLTEVALQLLPLDYQIQRQLRRIRQSAVSIGVNQFRLSGIGSRQFATR